MQARLASAPNREADELLERVFCVLRTADATTAAWLLEAMAPICDAAGEGEALRETLAAVREGARAAASAPGETADPRRNGIAACLAEACASAGAWRAAIARFRVPPKAEGFLNQVRCELARCVGQDFLSGFAPTFAPAGPRRIFDLFPFNGEVELLRLKLEEMGPWVDRFVIVEAAETFTGRRKTPYFPQQAAAFADFMGKIVYVPVDRFPAHLTSPWAREFHQRDQAATGLKGLCAPTDLVILSDVDEVLRREAVENFHGLGAGACLKIFRYFLNCEARYEKAVVKAAIVRADQLARNGSSYLRLGLARHARNQRVADAGWHFTSVLGPDELERKFQSFSHVEHAHLDRDYFEELKRRFRSGRIGSKYVRRALDEDLPGYIARNREALEPYLL